MERAPPGEGNGPQNNEDWRNRQRRLRRRRTQQNRADAQQLGRVTQAASRLAHNPNPTTAEINRFIADLNSFRLDVATRIAMQVNSLRSFDEICAGFLAAIHHRDALRHEQHARARAGTNNSPEASAAPNDAVQPNATLQVGEPGRGRNRIHREERARRRARRRARDGGQAEPSQADAVFLEGLDGLIREETDRADAQSRDHHPNRGN